MALPLPLRIARRELRAGLRGFRIFLACLALGVAAIAAVGSISAAFVEGLAQEGRTLLGGDVEVELVLRDATSEELDWLQSTGQVSHIATMRATAIREDREARRLVSLKAVDRLYPMVGEMALSVPVDVQRALADQDGIYGAVAEPALLRRLEIEVGDRIIIGTQLFEIRAEIVREPDATTAFRLGPRVLISLAGLQASGLVQEGSLIDHNYRVLFPDPAPDVVVRDWVEQARETFPDSDWQIQTRSNASPGARNFVRQVSVFLTLVGLTALVVGGVGVGNGVHSYLERKKSVIATFKCLGATGPLVFQSYFAQVMILSVLGIVIGLALGALAPFLVAWIYGNDLPIPARFGLYTQPLLLAGAYGVLVAAAFSIWPLARAREVPAAGLFRDLVAPARRWPRPEYIVASGVALVLMGALAVLFTENRTFALVFLIGAALAFAILRGAAVLIAQAAKAAGRPKRPALRLALANLYRPGAPTSSVVLSLGLGLTLLVTVSLIDGNISAQVRDRLPEDAAAFFFIDIPKDGVDEFDAILGDIEGVGDSERVSSLRGRITRINGVPAEEAEVAEEGRWTLRGDRGVTYASEVPVNSTIVEGAWWPEDYDGPPLLSIDQDIARAFGIGIGDTLTLNIAGREITAEIANLRNLDWETIGLNFLFVYSPGLLEAAPHTFVAAVYAAPEAEDELERRVSDAFPSVAAVRVREALDAFNSIVEDLALAVRGTSGVTLIAGVLVLAGAMAAGHRQRMYDASVLKVLGATRNRVMAAYILEYALLGLATAVMAAGAGTLAAYLVITEVMDAPWVFLPWTVATTVFAATAVTIVLGLAGTWQSLGVPAARVLRSE